jgi:hypothetical protein
LDAYREHIDGFAPESVFEHVDATSLVWRMELAGGEMPGAWQVLASRFGRRPHEQLFPFLNAHYVFALARAGARDEARQAIAVAETCAARATGARGELWTRVGVPLLRGCLAAGEGDADACVGWLDPIERELGVGGGSDAQADVFSQALLDARIQGGRRADARAQLERRLAGRAPMPLEERWLALV